MLRGACWACSPRNDIRWRNCSWRGDAVLFYSDGFETAFPDPAGIVNDRYRQEFRKLAGSDPAAKFKALEKELDRQEGSLHPRDDLTAVLLSIG